VKNKKSSSRFYVSPLDDGKGVDKWISTYGGKIMGFTKFFNWTLVQYGLDFGRIYPCLFGQPDQIR